MGKEEKIKEKEENYGKRRKLWQKKKKAKESALNGILMVLQSDKVIISSLEFRQGFLGR